MSVRNLVEFLLRSGDLDNRRSGGEKEAMQAGSRIHRKIQKQMGSSYRAEVPMKYEIEREGFTFLIEGRADGIQEKDGQVLIDEIKGTYRSMEILTEPVLVHYAESLGSDRLNQVIKHFGFSVIALQCIMTGTGNSTEEVAFRFKEQCPIPVYYNIFMVNTLTASKELSILLLKLLECR